MVTHGFRHPRQRLDVFREAGAAIADPRVQKEGSDPPVHAHALGHDLDVGVDPLTDTRHLVDEGDSGGEKRVRRVLDHLGRMEVGDQDPGLQLAVEPGHRPRGRFVVRSEHQAVRMHEVVDGAAFAEKLRIRHHREGDLVPQVLADDPGHDVAGPDGHGALVDDGHGLLHRGGDALGRLLDVDQIGLTPPAGRRADGDEHEVGARDRLGIIAGETKPARLERLAHELVQPRLVDGRLAARHPGDFGLVDVHARDLVTDVGQAHGGRQADVAGADDCDRTHILRV